MGRGAVVPVVMPVLSAVPSIILALRFFDQTTSNVEVNMFQTGTRNEKGFQKMTTVDISDPEKAKATVMTWYWIQKCQQVFKYMGMSFFWSTSVHRNDKVGGMRFHLLVIQHTDHIFLCVLRRNREQGGNALNYGPYIGIYPITDSVLNFQISLMLPVCGTGQHPTNDNANFDVLCWRECLLWRP